MRLTKLVLISIILTLGVGVVSAQNGMPKSPRGTAATQIGGKWITIDYGRPILRGRRGIFGEGEDYGKKMYAGAPVWRMGANKSTRIKTETDLMFGDTKLPAGEYSMFVELKEAGWTLIISNLKAKASGRGDGDGIWGSYGYDTKMDVARVPMNVVKINNAIDQLTFIFMDVTDEGGTMGVVWENVMGVASFKVATEEKKQ